MKQILIKIILLSVLLASEINAENIPSTYYEQNWGIGAVMRTASIPYVTDAKKYVDDFIPLMFFENDYIFLHGIESGFKFHETANWRLSAITRVRYVDLPKRIENKYQEDSTDFGAQIRYKISNNQFIDLEGMSDSYSRYFSNLKYSSILKTNKLEYRPYAELRWSTKKFNSYYYGLNIENISSNFDTSLGVDFKYHLVSNFYILARLQGRYIGSDARKSSFVEDKFETEASLGFAFFNNAKKNYKSPLSTTPYLKLAHGWASPSDLAEILVGKGEKDIHNNKMTSLFYGYPLSNELFGLPLDFYLTPGFVLHKSSSTQKSSQEYIMAIKAYYTIPMDWRIRLGAAEGISYIDNITFIESSELKTKYKPSKLLNYLNFTLDINLGDIFTEKLDKAWLGVGIHHRSAIFESSSRFGRIKGGSNYNTVYLQWDF